MICPIIYCYPFWWILIYNVKGVKLMLFISCMGKVKVLIEFLAMCGGVYIRKILCICLHLSSLDTS